MPRKDDGSIALLGEELRIDPSVETTHVSIINRYLIQVTHALWFLVPPTAADAQRSTS